MLQSSLKHCGRKFLPLGNSHCTNTGNFVEVEIPVPWGKIAGKWWGSKEKKPILVLHGYQVHFIYQLLVYLTYKTMNICVLG